MPVVGTTTKELLLVNVGDTDLVVVAVAVTVTVTVPSPPPDSCAALIAAEALACASLMHHIRQSRVLGTLSRRDHSLSCAAHGHGAAHSARHCGDDDDENQQHAEHERHDSHAPYRPLLLALLLALERYKRAVV